MSASHDPSALSAAVKTVANAIGFDACGIAAFSPIDPEGNLARWLGLGYHADMAWIARTQDIREDLSLKLPGKSLRLVNGYCGNLAAFWPSYKSRVMKASYR